MTAICRYAEADAIKYWSCLIRLRSYDADNCIALPQEGLALMYKMMY